MNQGVRAAPLDIVRNLAQETREFIKSRDTEDGCVGPVLFCYRNPRLGESYKNCFPSATLVPPTELPVLCAEILAPAKVVTSPSSKTVVDFGHDFLGRLRIKPYGPIDHHKHRRQRGDTKTKPQELKQHKPL